MKAIKPPKVKYNQKKWRPNCSVCQYMKRNKDFRTEIFTSTYFTSTGTKSPMKITRTFNAPFEQPLLYACLKRHHGHLVNRVATQVVDGQVIVDARFKPTFEVIENVGATSNAELGLEEFIKQGREKLARGEMQITATTFVAALGKRMDIDAKTKDRRADMLQGLFKGAAPKQELSE